MNIKKVLRQKLINFVCPKCGKYMFTEPGFRFMTNPPKYKLVCGCGEEKYVVCEEVKFPNKEAAK